MMSGQSPALTVASFPGGGGHSRGYFKAAVEVAAPEKHSSLRTCAGHPERGRKQSGCSGGGYTAVVTHTYVGMYTDVYVLLNSLIEVVLCTFLSQSCLWCFTARRKGCLFFPGPLVN